MPRFDESGLSLGVGMVNSRRFQVAVVAPKDALVSLLGAIETRVSQELDGVELIAGPYEANEPSPEEASPEEHGPRLSACLVLGGSTGRRTLSTSPTRSESCRWYSNQTRLIGLVGRPV